MSGHRSWMRRAASMPSSPGIAMSSTATSGGVSAAKRHCAAGVAEAADHADVGLRREQRLQAVAHHRVVVEQQDVNRHRRLGISTTTRVPRPGTRRAAAPPMRLGALAHRRSGRSRRASRCARRAGIGEAAAVVLHRQAQRRRHSGSRSSRWRRRCAWRRWSAPPARCGTARAPRRAAGARLRRATCVVTLMPVRWLKSDGVPAQRRHQAELLQRRGPQVGHHAADGVDGGFHQPRHRVEARAGDRVAAAPAAAA